jgi:hypothetical protein
MTHPKVYNEFKIYFPNYAEHAKAWFPNGKNSIRVRMYAGDIVFTYNGTRDWSLETLDSHIERMEERRGKAL